MQRVDLIAVIEGLRAFGADIRIYTAEFMLG